MDVPHADDERWSRCFAQLQSVLQLPSDAAVSYALHGLVSESEEHASRVVCGLLHGMLHEPKQLSWYFGQLCCCSRDAHRHALSELQQLALWRYPRLSKGSKGQLLVVLSQLIDTRTARVETLFTALLRQVGTGDCTHATLWLGDNLLSLLIHHRAWLLDAPDLVPAVLLSFLRLATEHPPGTMRERRERELQFCHDLLMARRSECVKLGRDLLLALHPFRDTAPFAPMWSEWQTNAAMLWAVPARAQDLRTRVTPEAERCLRFMLHALHTGEQRRHLLWFAERHLDQRGLGAVQDMLRWMCVCVEPTSEMRASSFFPRWMLAGWLLGRASPTNEVNRALARPATVPNGTGESQRVQWALILDLLGFADGESVKHTEPALTLLVRCVDRSMQGQSELAGKLLQTLLAAPKVLTPSCAHNARMAISKAMHAFSHSAQVALSSTSVRGARSSGQDFLQCVGILQA